MRPGQTKSFVERPPFQRRSSRTTASGGLFDVIGGEALQGSGFEDEQPEDGFDDSGHREGTESEQGTTVKVSLTNKDVAR
jgi:hypothetical protein